MGKVMILMVYYGLLTISVGGQMNSDPAPGRSPGPPGMNTFYDEHGVADGSPTLLLTKDVEDEQRNRVEKKVDVIPLAIKSDSAGLTNQSGNVDVQTRDVKLPKKSSEETKKTSSSCNYQLSDYLRANDKVVNAEVRSVVGDNETNGEHPERLRPGRIFSSADINLDVIHEIFDTHNGITCGLMYKVRLSIAQNVQVEDFFLETMTDDQNRGTFIRNPMNNKLPISWFKSSFVTGTSWAVENFQKRSSWDDNDHDHDSGDDEDDDDANVLLPIDRWAKKGDFLGENSSRLRDSVNLRKSCMDNTWTSNNLRDNKMEEWSAFWMLNEFCDRENDSVEFRLFFRIAQSSDFTDSGTVFRRSFLQKINKECQLFLKQSTGLLDYAALPLYNVDCTVNFPSPEEYDTDAGDDDDDVNNGATKDNGDADEISRQIEAAWQRRRPPGLLIQLTRLNVPCDSGGFVKFSENLALCGKLEELRANERTYHFNMHKNTSVKVHKNPMFSLKYQLVDYCFNMSLSEQNGSFYLHPAKESLECYFRIHLPYGYQIDLSLVTNNRTSDFELAPSSDGNKVATTATSDSVRTHIAHINISLGKNNDSRINDVLSGHSDNTAVPDQLSCSGLAIRIYETSIYKWSYCADERSGTKAFSLTSQSNTLVLHVVKVFSLTDGTTGNRDDNGGVSGEGLPSLYFAYSAKPIPDIVSDCAFGWVAVQQFCVSTVEMAMSWYQSEQFCVSNGGHLVSIRSEIEQKTIDQLLLNSPGYQDRFAYWVGASDKSYEGDFRWNDGLPFSYTHWFPGWSQHGHYNKQPNDDGLSGQDCIELRRDFRVPPGVQPTKAPLAETYMWNDRDCNARNYFICERPIADEPVEKNWSRDCNKTISLTKERTRESLWSPSFPRQYPDNANCFTTVTAPSGYRIVLEFEELVIENEPGCSYDYLEITEPSAFHSSQNGGKVSELLQSSASSLSSLSSSSSAIPYTRSSRHGSRRNTYRKRNSYDSNLSVNSNSNNLNSINFNMDIAQSNYQNLLSVFTNLYKPRTNFLIQTPDYPRGNPLFHTSKQRDSLPRRMCGDWSSKLKLLRYMSGGSYLGLHFTSDYSHHYGGYKAKVFMENTASECSDERLKPYNGSCYLIVSYPEVDWWTAQQVCRGIGAQLSSVSSPDEHRFITSSIRNQADYSPQLIYWLGGELASNKQFEWTDDTKMKFQGWLPGQGQFDEMPAESVCLGLQWKMSPTPMLPSGLYWESQRCRRVGGYICKKAKQPFDNFQVKNETVSGSEGRLTSPGYPNPYPLNIDYWVRIVAPERSRIVVQFQKIDLEAQDECLYDYVSVQNYETISEIALEPGSNPIPMAMLTSDKSYNDLLFLDDRMQHIRRSRNADNTNDKSNENLKRQSAIKMSRRRSQVDVAMQKRSILTSNLQEVQMASRKSFSRIPLNRKRRRKKREQIENPLMDSSSSPAPGGGEPASTDDRLKRSSSFRNLDNSQSFLPYVRWCGSHDTNMSKFDFISAANEVMLNVHSDYSISGLGFAAVWKAIDMLGCPFQTLTAREGVIMSPNYPNFLINNLDCTYVIQAPIGRKVWLEFTDYRITEGASLELDIGYGRFQPFKANMHLNEGIFVSFGEQIKVQIKTGLKPRGRGFRAFYKTVGPTNMERVIQLTSNATGLLFHLNHPQLIPGNVDYTQHLIAPLGEVILLELHGVEFSQNGCADHTILEVFDNYADNNGTRWQLCKFQESHSLVSDSSASTSSSNRRTYSGYSEPQHAPVYITSYLNTLHVRQKTTTESHIGLNATVRIQQDINYKLKLTTGDDLVESCQPNPCQSNGKCITTDDTKRCQCHGHFTGRFCGLNMCELEPCLFGKCELTPTNFKCNCQSGYIGPTCEQKQKPCADNPCEGRGECFEKSGGYMCRCHAWWEGNRCERRMMHIPYKPLSERMLQEPFWLGLITVFVVLAVIGLVWCAKRHFPEKIEKLLAEEADRNRPPGAIHGHHHHTSLREQLQFTTSIPQTTATTPGAPRSIFNRLGIRKPSILSLSSPNPPGGATARTFSLDDLLRPPPRRSPSPRKKRNNSTPTKKNAAEKKQILQQLVSPAATQLKPKISLGELIQMSENRLKANVLDSESDLKETTFSEISVSMSASASASMTRPLTDPKLEKKVTFARLLSKVSAEMSSGSEMDGGIGTHNSSALSLPTEIQYRANSVPQSPCTNDMRSPHSTSSNQGSDSLSSSDLALTDIGLRNLHNRRIRPKVSSADSILAMFRNFASTTPSGTSLATSSIFVSPSTTPTASSPQDDALGDDESSTSSMHTPVSFSSGAPDSPVFYRQTTIEVPVLDALSAHKTSPNATNMSHPPTILLEIPSNPINKCLSPIRELPTPMPSPALTPIMPRPQRSNSPIMQVDPLLANYSDEEERIEQQMAANLMSELQKEKNRIDSEVDTTPTDTTTTSIADMNRSSGLRSRVVPPVIITIDIDPPTPEERAVRPRDLIIPTLIVEQPSPTRDRYPMIILPGSPPPQRASIGETSFMFPNKQQQKRLLKQFEKPTSLDLPFVPPMITITSNMSELESDMEPMSPAPNKLNGGTTLLVPGNAGMCYLSPFTMCTRADRTISESNLSSSGYSSMASPGPSRCGSSNPLCPNEMDESGSGPPGTGLSLHASLINRRQSSLLASCKENVTNGKSSNTAAGNHDRLRGRSDSETLSDDALLESNDEGIGTDHIDEKIEEGEIKSAKELEVYISKDLLEVGKTIMLNPEENPAPSMSQLQLPSIVIQGDGTDRLSPVSSRSESPLSERAGMGRFSPHFYGRKDQLPFTDSDGLYDFPSSDGKGASVSHQRKSSSKKRDRKSSKTSQTQSPTRNHHLDLPSKEMVSSAGSHSCSKLFHHHHHPHHGNTLTARKSPKRRPVQRHPVTSSSSSTESLTSARELTLRAVKIGSPSRDKYLRKSAEGSEDDTGEDVSSQILPSMHSEDLVRPRKISRLRAIGNQIRFLRRLEKSIKRRERLSPSDSCPEDGNEELDSPQITSPLLQTTSTKPRISICRQKRLPSTIYTSAITSDRNWRSRERNIIHGDINSD